MHIPTSNSFLPSFDFAVALRCPSNLHDGSQGQTLSANLSVVGKFESWPLGLHWILTGMIVSGRMGKTERRLLDSLRHCMDLLQESGQFYVPGSMWLTSSMVRPCPRARSGRQGVRFEVQVFSFVSKPSGSSNS